MSRGITKPQLALAVAKGRLSEAMLLQERMRVGNSVSLVIKDRIKEIQKEIDEIQGNVPVYLENQRKGLIS